MRLGAGRSKADDRIDPAVGIELNHQVGDAIDKGEPLAIIHHNGPVDIGAVQKAFTIQAKPTRRGKLIINKIGA